jgi:hypothetical protein
MRHRTLTVLALVLFPVVAQAATQTHHFVDGSIGVQGDGFCSDIGGGGSVWSCFLEDAFADERFEIPQFDPAYGTLESVGFAVALDVDFDTTYEPEVSGHPAPESRNAFLQWSVEGTADPFRAARGSGSSTQAACEGRCTLLWSLESLGGSEWTDDLERFIGTGSLEMILDGSYWSEGVYLENMHRGGVRLELDVTYTYVPEPATGLLLAAGLLASVRRSKGRSAA